MISAEEIKELEKRWIKYKVKRHSKKAVLSLASIGVIAAGGYIYLQKPMDFSNLFSKKEEIKKKEQKEIKITQADKKIESIHTPPKNKKEQKEKTLTLDTKFIKNIEKEAKKSKTVFKKPPLPKPKLNPNFKIATSDIKEEKVVKKSKIKIISKKVDTITYLKKKFEASGDINYALMLSQTYYDKKDYKKALKWAIKANEIDASNEKSWILFAKSKMKLGKRKEAIKALKIYLKNRESQRVYNVLEKIENGDLKG